MRIREMAYYIEQINIDDAELSIKNEYITNLVDFKRAIEVLKNIPILQNDIIAIMEGALYSTPQDTIEISNSQFRFDTYRAGRDLLTKASLLESIANDMYPPLEDNSISLKLPYTKDMKLLYKSMKSFEVALSLLVASHPINSTITIDNWEHGSFWLNLCAGSALAVTVISSASWSAAVISKKIAEYKYIEQQVRTLSINNDSLEDILNAQKKETELLLENETQALIDTHAMNNDDPEQFARIKESIKVLAELIQQGAEVNPALSAPEDVKNLFPDYSKLDQVSSKIKQIQHK